MSDNDLINSVEVGKPFVTSDHNIIRFELITGCTIDNKISKPVFNYFKADYDLIRNELEILNLDSVVDKNSVESFWKTLKFEIIKVRDTM